MRPEQQGTATRSRHQQSVHTGHDTKRSHRRWGVLSPLTRRSPAYLERTQGSTNRKVKRTAGSRLYCFDLEQEAAHATRGTHQPCTRQGHRWIVLRRNCRTPQLRGEYPRYATGTYDASHMDQTPCAVEPRCYCCRPATRLRHWPRSRPEVWEGIKAARPCDVPTCSATRPATKHGHTQANRQLEGDSKQENRLWFHGVVSCVRPS